MKSNSIRSLPLRALILGVAVALCTPAVMAKDAGRALHELFKSDWEWQMQQFPTYASALGDHRFDDRLTDYSSAALAARIRHSVDTDRALHQIKRPALNAQDAVSYDLFRLDLDETLSLQKLYDKTGVNDSWTIINHLDGPHLAFSQMMASSRFDTVADYRNYLARLRAFGRQSAQAIAITRDALARGWSQPRVTLERVPGQIDRLLGKSTEDCSWHTPFEHLPPSIKPSERAALLNDAQAVFRADVVPALQTLKHFVADELIPAARTEIAASTLPGGPDYYRQRVRQMTTTEMSPEEIHRIGLGEVARISGAMDDLAKREGFAGNGVEFIKSVRQRPDQYYASGDELVAAYGALGKKVDPLIAGIVKEMPRLPWGVRAAPPEETGNSAYYLPGAADGSRAAFFIVDASSPQTSPKFEMAALLLHEAVPGHHLQNARAAELKNLPDFRRHAWYVAYGEGWALYAESLGEELGLYEQPLPLLGRYSYEIWRAARLVVDTGMHAKGWSRQQAIDYMVAATGSDVDEITSEIDRYIVWPGQALGYKLGELTIKRLRAKAERALGEKFDRRAFHSMVIDAGALPLSVLEKRTDVWIAGGGR